jgi:hypothetical protein
LFSKMKLLNLSYRSWLRAKRFIAPSPIHWNGFMSNRIKEKGNRRGKERKRGKGGKKGKEEKGKRKEKRGREAYKLTPVS